VWTDETGERKEGVFIPRRDTSSLVNHLGGGRIFPASTIVRRSGSRGRGDDRSSDALHGRSGDGPRAGPIRGRAAADVVLPEPRGGSGFFEPGSLGYSVTRQGGRLDGIELRTAGWAVEPLEVADVASSYFSDRSRFPSGSVEFDCALAMRNLAHEWHSADDLYV
jgi:hypothetical protein